MLGVFYWDSIRYIHFSNYTKAFYSFLETSNKRTWLYFKSTIETDSGNDRKNVTKEIEPDNDKMTVAKVNGSENDEEKITTKSGWFTCGAVSGTQWFNNEYFARILFGEVFITYLAYHFF